MDLQFKSYLRLPNSFVHQIYLDNCSTLLPKRLKRNLTHISLLHGDTFLSMEFFEISLPARLDQTIRRVFVAMMVTDSGR